jgi:site-specific recombinase
MWIVRTPRARLHSDDAELATSKVIVVSAAVPTVAEFRTIKEALAQCRKMLEELDEHGREGVASIDVLFKVVRQTWVQRKEALATEFTAAVASSNWKGATITRSLGWGWSNKRSTLPHRLSCWGCGG